MSLADCFNQTYPSCKGFCSSEKDEKENVYKLYLFI